MVWTFIVRTSLDLVSLACVDVFVRKSLDLVSLACVDVYCQDKFRSS